MFASFPNIKFDLNLFSCIVFFGWRVTFKHCTQWLHQLWQSADIAALCDVFVEIQIAKLQYSPEVNSHTHAAVATDGVMAERDSTLFLFLFICLCSPPLPVFFFFSLPYSLLIYLSSLLTTPPLTSVLPSSLPPTSTDNKYHVTRMAMLLHGTLHVY